MPSRRRPEGASLTNREVSDIRAVKAVGSAREMLALVERIVAAHTARAVSPCPSKGSVDAQ